MFVPGDTFLFPRFVPGDHILFPCFVPGDCFLFPTYSTVSPIQPIRFELCLIEPIGVVQKPLGTDRKKTWNVDCLQITSASSEDHKSNFVIRVVIFVKLFSIPKFQICTDDGGVFP